MKNRLSKLNLNLNNYQPLREVILESIREAIIMGELKPGDRIMENQFAEKMGVSRTPVREAIRKLELEGLVTMIPRRGAYVTELSAKNIKDVLEVRSCLEVLATSLAAKRISNDELKKLKLVVQQFEKYIEKNNVQGLIKKDIEFHDIIYKASSNEKLIQIITNLKNQIHRFRVTYLKKYSNVRELYNEHNEIYNAIKKGDQDLAEKVALIHIRHQEEAMIQSFKKVEDNLF